MNQKNANGLTRITILSLIMYCGVAAHAGSSGGSGAPLAAQTCPMMDGTPSIGGVNDPGVDAARAAYDVACGGACGQVY